MQHTIGKVDHVAKCTGIFATGSSTFGQDGIPHGSTTATDGSPGNACPDCIKENLAFIRLHDEDHPGPWEHEYLMPGGSVGVHLSARPEGHQE